MTWFEQSANQTEATRDHCRPFVAVDFDFPSAHVRAWSGYDNLVIGADTFTGVGSLGKITWPSERGLDAPRKTFTLALYGYESTLALVSESDLLNCYERTITEYLGWIDVNTGLLVATPEVTYWLFDNIARFRGPEPRIEINAEHHNKLLEKASDWRWTHEHQQQFYSGDTGFKYTPDSLLREIVWGGKIVSGSGAGGPGGGGSREIFSSRRVSQ